ncbi:hypothetical protein HOA64_02105 [bacterium]|nr:hypothetical protein [bacterium]MBT7772490.1 hypothetical protein [bacterium]
MEKLKKILKFTGIGILLVAFAVSGVYMLIIYGSSNGNEHLGGGTGLNLSGLTGWLARGHLLSFCFLWLGVLSVFVAGHSIYEHSSRETESERKTREKDNKFWTVISFIGWRCIYFSPVALFILSLLDYLICVSDFVHLMHPVFYLSTMLLLLWMIFLDSEKEEISEKMVLRSA